MSENQDPKPAAEGHTAEAMVTNPENTSAGPGAEKTPEEQLASAHAQLLAAQQQMHDAQQRLQAAQAALDARLRDQQGDSALPENDQAASPQGLLRRPHATPQQAQSDPIPPTMPQHEDGEKPAQPETDAAQGSGQETSPAPEAGPVTFSYGPLNSVFGTLVKLGPIALLALLACMAWPIFLEPSMATYCPAELKSLTAFLHSTATNSWFTPVALGDGGTFNAPQWPLYTWCLALLACIPQLANGDWILPVVSFGSAFLAAFGVWALAMAAGFGSISAMAAGLILLCAPLFAPLPHFVGPAALAAGMLLLALAFFCKGWMTPKSWIALPLGFVFTALAGLAGGVLHFAVPLIASFLFLLWRADFRRAQRLDALIGFILMLAIGGAWLAAIMIGDDKSDYLNLLFASAFQFVWPVELPWLKAVAAGLLGLLPWLLIIVAVSWLKVLGHSARTLGASRRDNGSAMIWISLALALVISVFIPWFHPAAVAICCLAAILLGKAFVNLGKTGNRFFFLLAALLLILIGAVVISLTFFESQNFIFRQVPCLAAVPDLGARLLALPMLKAIGGILIVGGVLSLLFVRRYMACGGLVYAALLVIALSMVARLLLVPELQTMPGTPLVTYATVEENVMAAMKAAPGAQPKTALDEPGSAATAPASVPSTETASQPAPAATPAPLEDRAVPASPLPEDTSSKPQVPAETTPSEPAGGTNSDNETPAAPKEPEAGETPAADSAAGPTTAQ